MIEKTLMIHEIEKDFFDLDLSGYRLTFDDGLYAQYYYYPVFEHYNTKMIYFICICEMNNSSYRINKEAL